MTATSLSVSTASSWAFFMRPALRLRYVTERLRSSAMRWILIFLRPIWRWVKRERGEATMMEDHARWCVGEAKGERATKRSSSRGCARWRQGAVEERRLRRGKGEERV
jgi:hypothetical protein